MGGKTETAASDFGPTIALPSPADADGKSPDSELVETAEAEAFFKTPGRNRTAQIRNYGEVELPRAA